MAIVAKTLETPTVMAGRARGKPCSRHTRSRGIDSLTGIRGVAAVWVLLTHYQAVMAAYLNDPSINGSSFLYNGFRGVDLFFVLSGFILMIVHGNDFTTFDAEKLRGFYILRFFRVYPLNAVIMFALVPLCFALPGLVDWFRVADGVPIPYHSHDFSLAGFFQSLFLAQTWTVLKLGEWNGPAWSLSAEVFGYAMFPLLAAFLMRRRSVASCVGIALASLATLMVLLAVFGHTQDSPTGTFGLIRMIFAFIAGMSMARCFQMMSGDSRVGGPVALASMIFIVAVLIERWSNMFVVFGFTGLIFGLAFQQGPINTVLASPPAMFLGRISFSLYMIHYVPLKMSLWLLQTWLTGSSLPLRIACLVAVVALCLTLAMLTHRYLEVPFQRYARKAMQHGSGSKTRVVSA